MENDLSGITDGIWPSTCSHRFEGDSSRRQKRGLIPVEPTRLDTLVLPDEFKSTEQPLQPFLIYDSGAAAAKRTLQALGHCIKLVR